MALAVPSNAGYIAVDTSSSPKTFQLPYAGDLIGRIIQFKDAVGNAATNPITILTQSPEMIDGLQSYIITEPFGSVTLVSKGGIWMVQQGTQRLNVSTLTAQNEIVKTLSTNSISSGTSVISSIYANYGSINSLLTSNFFATGISSINMSTATLLTSSINTKFITTSNIFVPFSTIDSQSTYLMKASTNQITFGMYNSSGQIYVGDVYAALGDLNRSTPTVVVDSPPIIISGTTSYSVTGSNDTFTVPQGTYLLRVKLSGAGGGLGVNSANGGNGGYVEGDLVVTPGEVLTIIVGQGGASGGTTTTFGGGARGYTSGGSGGGRSAIQRSGADIVTAGGGGGGSKNNPSGNSNGYGGAGGGLTGQDGTTVDTVLVPDGGGKGGTQSAGGAGGTSGFGNASNGSLSTGGAASPTNGGGGGGGGYYGGGGGVGSGAGGGSSYVANLTGTVTNTQGGGGAGGVTGTPNGTSGSIIITYFTSYKRPGNILEISNYLQRKVIVDANLNMGINVVSTNASYALEVVGNGKMSSLTLGTTPSTGILYADALRDLYWNGTKINGGGGAGDVTQASLNSTIQGLGTYAYLSSLTGYGVSTGYAVMSTLNLVDPFLGGENYLTVSSGTLLLNGAFITGGAGGTAVSQIVAGTNINVLPAGGTGVVTIDATGPSQDNVTSTLIGLGTLGFVSSLSLVSTTAAVQYGYQTAGFLSSGNLLSTVEGLGTASYVSTLSMNSSIHAALSSFSTAFGPGGTNMNTITSTVAGLGTAGYLSSISYPANLSASALFVSSISTNFIQTTVLSTLALLASSIVAGTNRAITLSSQQLNVSSVNGGLLLATSNLTSTVAGLGQNYISTATINSFFSTFSTTISRSFNSSNVTISTLFASNATMSNLTVSTITFDTGDGFIDFPDIRALSLSTFFINTSTINVGAMVSTQVLEVSSIRGVTFLSLQNLASTVDGLGTTGYVSTPNLVSTTAGLQYGYQTAGFLSTPNLVSTTSGLQTEIQDFFSSLSTSYTLNFKTSSIVASNISSLDIVGNNIYAFNSVQVLDGILSVQNYSGVVPYTAVFGASNLNVDVIYALDNAVAWEQIVRDIPDKPMAFVYGQGPEILTLDGKNSRIGVVNKSPQYNLDVSGNIFASTMYTTSLNLLDINTPVYNDLTVSSGVLLLNSLPISGGGGGTGDVSKANLLSTVTGLGTVGYVSSLHLTSTVAGLGTSEYISSLSLYSSLIGLGTTGYISTPSLVSTVEGITTAVVDLVAGLGTAGYVSTLSLASSIISTTSFIGQSFSSFSTANSLNEINFITSTVRGLGTAGYISTATMVSTITGSLSSFSTAIGAAGSGAITSIPNNLSTMAIFTSSLLASSITASTINTSTLIGSQSQFVTLSSLALYVSSFYTATRQVTPMFIAF